MAEQKSRGLRDRLQDNPGTSRLVEEAEAYLQARLEKGLGDMTHRLEGAAEKLGQGDLGGLAPQGLVSALGKGGQRLASGASPGSAVLGMAKDSLMDKVKGLTGKKGGGGKRSGAGGKSLLMIEDVDVGVPVREAYDQWTQFQHFSRFAKGVVQVEREDDVKSQWHVKIAKSNRSWTGKVTEMVPDERIAWTSEGAKGTTKGVVTFHPLGENLTRVLLVMEYYPHGLVEKTGALWRAQGRRARLDLKRYRSFLTMRGEATGGWGGEIRDGEVVRGPDEEAEEDREPEEDEEAASGEQQDQRADEDEYGEGDEEEEGAEDGEDSYDDEDEEDDAAHDQPEARSRRRGQRDDEPYEDTFEEDAEDAYEDEEPEEEERPRRSRR
ncbi:SRPBCC family protein [Streptomyces palmae]|uniref:SRPBCC family protein n=1 Tax=Streptomyces palmae TaxID=1701085 RepID=A0A4Z0HGL8_9ACTN|nr:SRPBCC family protein [Streptomyces palmae]TGB19377.1 SRPBCC family protein [Streptomyces palmae]